MVFALTVKHKHLLWRSCYSDSQSGCRKKLHIWKLLIGFPLEFPEICLIKGFVIGILFRFNQSINHRKCFIYISTTFIILQAKPIPHEYFKVWNFSWNVPSDSVTVWRNMRETTIHDALTSHLAVNGTYLRQFTTPSRRTWHLTAHICVNSRRPHDALGS